MNPLSPGKGRGEADAFYASILSTFAVDKERPHPHMGFSGSIPKQKETEMRILEMAIAGVIAVGAQALVVGTLLI